MSSSKITIVGAENYLQMKDTSLFALATFPAGIDKSLVLDAVIMRGGEFEILYADPEYMQAASARWARRWNRTFSKWVNALNVNYDPLYNYDRREEWTTTDDGQELTTRNLSDTETRNLSNNETRNLTDLETRNLATTGSRTTETDTTGSSTDTGSGTSTDSVSAYNSNVFENDRKNDSTSTGTTSTTSEQTQTETTSGSDTGTVNRSDTGTVNRSDTGSVDKSATGSVNTERDNVNVRKGRAYGNIGVTTSQQMLQSELDLQYWNLYDHIADIYLQEFAIPVY